MKKLISLGLVGVMALSMIPTALATTDYTNGTRVEYTASGSESYTITVPAQLAPGGSGTVTLSGTWADNRIVTVTADPTVTLKNSFKETDQKVLDITFDGISEAGSNTGSQTFTESVSVADIQNALFGKWSGKFNYNVEMTDVAAVEIISFDIFSVEDQKLTTYQAELGMTWAEWVESKYNTLGAELDSSGYILVAPARIQDYGDYVYGSDTINGETEYTLTTMEPIQ